MEGLTYLPRQDGSRKWVAWDPTAARYLRFEPTEGTANVASVATIEVAVAGARRSRLTAARSRIVVPAHGPTAHPQ